MRETAYDVLFEEDIDEMSLTTMILETINNVSKSCLSCVKLYGYCNNYNL